MLSATRLVDRQYVLGKTSLRLRYKQAAHAASHLSSLRRFHEDRNPPVIVFLLCRDSICCLKLPGEWFTERELSKPSSLELRKKAWLTTWRFYEGCSSFGV